MSLLQKFIDYDKQLTFIFQFLDSNPGLIKNNKGRVGLLYSGFSKISIFEENNRIFKVLTKTAFKQQQALSYLIHNLLELTDIILPYKIEYEGENFTIISQKKLNSINNSFIVDLINKKTVNIINSKYLNNNINQYLALTSSADTYNKFIDCINLLNVTDLVSLENFGMENDVIKCIDFENFNRTLTVEQLNLFFKKYNIDLGKAINDCPLLINLITIR